MGGITDINPGNTPLSPDEQEALIPNLATQQELNQWERANILAARAWALGERQLKKCNPITESYVRELHRKMFDQTWRWAGVYRRSEKNIGVLAQDIRERIGVLLGDADYWIVHGTYGTDEIAIRVHHQLTLIHPFPNGNGRHARLLADVIAVKFGQPEFTWGRVEMAAPGPVRAAYLNALKLADTGNIAELLRFSRS
jgi:Fic-DOC domain mobile mystery protein B